MRNSSGAGWAVGSSLMSDPIQELPTTPNSPLGTAAWQTWSRVFTTRDVTCHRGVNFCSFTEAEEWAPPGEGGATRPPWGLWTPQQSIGGNEAKGAFSAVRSPSQPLANPAPPGPMAAWHLGAG